MVLPEGTVLNNLPDELAEVVQEKIREMERQGLTYMPVKYLHQNTTIDAKTKKLRPGAKNGLVCSKIIDYKNRRYQLGSFIGDPALKMPQRHTFNPISGMLNLPLTDLPSITLVVLHPSTKGSMFSKNHTPLYEIINPAREAAIATQAEEVKKYVDFFIDKKLWGADFQTVARRMGVSDLSDIMRAKRQIKQKYENKLLREDLIASLEANSEKFKPFSVALEKVYSSQYMLSTDEKTGEQSWFEEGEEIAKVEERDYTTYLSLVEYEEKQLETQKKAAQEALKKAEAEKTKSTTPKK